MRHLLLLLILLLGCESPETFCADADLDGGECPDIDANLGENNDTVTDTPVDGGSSADIDTDTDTDTGSESDSDTDSCSDTDTDSDTSSDSATCTDSETDSETLTDTDTEVSDCPLNSGYPCTCEPAEGVCESDDVCLSIPDWPDTTGRSFCSKLCWIDETCETEFAAEGRCWLSVAGTPSCVLVCDWNYECPSDQSCKAGYCHP
jgi:hypothetical protein